MSRYAEEVVAAVLSATMPDGRGGYLRIMSDVEPDRAHAVLTEERDAAQQEVDTMRGSPSTVHRSSAMQILILTTLLLAKPDQAVDLSIVSIVQPDVGAVRSLDMAAKDLAAMLGKTLEIVEQA